MRAPYRPSSFISFGREDEKLFLYLPLGPPLVINPTRRGSQGLRWNPQAPCLQNPDSSQRRRKHRDELHCRIVAVTVFGFVVSHVITSVTPTGDSKSRSNSKRSHSGT